MHRDGKWAKDGSTGQKLNILESMIQIKKECDNITEPSLFLCYINIANSGKVINGYFTTE